MKKQVIGVLLAVLLAVMLCGCSQHDDVYEDTEALTSAANHYAALLWWQPDYADGRYTLRAGSFSGVRTLGSFTVQQAQTPCDVSSTIQCSKGRAKLVLVNAEEKSIAAEWPLDGTEPEEVLLPAGRYTLRLAGQHAAFKGEVSVTLAGKAIQPGTSLEDVQESMQDAMGATAESALQSVAKAILSAVRPRT